MNITSKLLTATLAAASLLGTAFAQAPAAQPAPAPAPAKTKTAAPKAAPAPAPTADQIADAKTKGMVWVNLNTKVYHKDGEFYGKTKNGKFMTEDDAKKAGYRLAQEPPAKKTPTKKPSPATK